VVPLNRSNVKILAMANRALIAAALSLLLSTSAGAEKQLNLYDCDSYKDMVACDGSCKQNSNRAKIRFRVSKEDKTVLLVILYGNGRRMHTQLLSNCVIFDVENWRCKKEDKLSDQILVHEDNMTMGIFESHGYFTPPDKMSEQFAKVCGK